MTGSVGQARDGLRGRLPDCFIVGHGKSGTSALYRMLSTHPQLYMPQVKEPWFFVPELRSSIPGRRHAKHPNTLEDYVALFAAARPDQIIGEGTSSYLFSREAARRIAEVQPNARIIAILREPASFLRSLHLQFLRVDVETEKDLGRAIALEGSRRNGRRLPRNSTRPQMLMYSEHVRYVEQLRRYEAVFPREHILVLIYEDFRADNEGTVRQVLRFLELDDSPPIVPMEKNPTRQMRSPRAHGLVRAVYLGRGPLTRPAKAAIKAVTGRRLRRRAISIERRAQLTQPDSSDEELLRGLRRRFKGEVVALSEHLGRDLVTYWGYDELG
jgi:Sulfotransferase family